MNAVRPLPGWSRALLAALAAWALVAVLAAVADYRDQLHAGASPSFGHNMAIYSLVFIPFSLLSGMLAAVFARLPARSLRPAPLLAGYLLTLAVFLPVYGVYEVAALTALDGKPVPGLVALLGMSNPWGRFLDGLMISLAFLAQIVHAYWRRGHDQERASQDARRANLSMRLALLQGQLEPAFLLSALDGISELVRNAERPLATRALARLSDLLRYALRSSTRERLSMADEIGFLRDYLDLQGLRFGARLQVQWEIEQCDWSAQACPALLLHALVEQSVVRGLEHGHCRLHIGMAQEQGQVRVRVERERTSAALAPPDLGPTVERLQLLYGSAARLDLHAAPASDCLTLILPASGHDDD